MEREGGIERRGRKGWGGWSDREEVERDRKWKQRVRERRGIEV